MSAAALMMGTAGRLIRFDSINGGGSTQTVSRQATASADLQLAFMGRADSTAQTWTGDTGWTEDVDQGTGVCLRVAHIAASGGTTSWTFTNTAAAASKSAVVLTVRGASFDAIGTIASTSSGAAIAPGSVTVASANSMLLMLCVSKDAATFTTPSGMVLVAQDTTNVPSWAVFRETVAAGATGAARSTTGGATDNAAVLVSLTLT